MSQCQIMTGSGLGGRPLKGQLPPRAKAQGL